MRRLIVLMVLLAVLFSLVGAASTGAAGEIKVVSSVADPKFGEGITFRLEAEASSEIVEIRLLYRDMLEVATNRSYPAFQPGTTVTAEHTWELLPGELPPGTQVSYYWDIRTADGGRLKTEPTVLSYDDSRFDWKEIDDGKVRLFYYGNDETRANRLLKTAVEALDRISQQIGVTPELKAKVYLYGSKSDMAMALYSRSESYDAMTTTLGVLVSEDTLLLLSSEPDSGQTMAHELTHLVVGQATDNPYQAPIPRWLDEGLAMYNEGKLPGRNREALDWAIENDVLISVRSMTGYSGDAAQVNLFYAQSYSLAEYLLKEYGKDKMVELLQVFRRGAYQDDALKEVYDFDIDQLDDQWREYVGARPRHNLPGPGLDTA